MKRKMKRRVSKPLLVSWFVLFLGAALSFNSCVMIAKYDPIALEKATSLKTESLMLMNKAVEPYTGHEQEVEDLLLMLGQAYEYASNKPRNKHSAAQWKIMWEPGRNLLAGFMKRWKEEGSLNDPFITEAKNQVSRAFDMIIDLENGKKR